MVWATVIVACLANPFKAQTPGPPTLPEVLSILGPFGTSGSVGEGPAQQGPGNQAVVGDIDGDGVADFVAGAPIGLPGVATLMPEIRAISGATGAVFYTLAPPSGVHIGTGIANIGDLDGDGVDDFGSSEFSFASGWMFNVR